ncbi:histidine phosphatase family protein [Pseudophaeobacter arcticus]|uniref:histidine phosphatase family protein n=1 Tax=Pseudophaeobacter arcticus TaxID=385492 RepID=UPI0024931702|nr:histidine phosphatase family protein [Pseudophaeobacter arcticus]
MSAAVLSWPKLPPQSICLIRHGETTANRDGIIAGRLDVALTDLGRQQARALQAHPWPGAIALFSSPLERAQETCRLGFPDQNFHCHPGLRERNWGRFEGAPLSELPPREGRPTGGEDWSEMITRVARAITTCCAQAQDRLPVLVCHSGVIRAIRLLAGQQSSGRRPANAHPISFVWLDDSHKEIAHAL